MLERLIYPNETKRSFQFMIQEVVYRVRFAVLWEYFGITSHSSFIAEVA
jgi:hypothetical protein